MMFVLNVLKIFLEFKIWKIKIAKFYNFFLIYFKLLIEVPKTRILKFQLYLLKISIQLFLY